MTGTSTDLAERYGRSDATRRRVVVLVSGLVGVVALGWVVWATWLQVTPAVSSTLQTFDVVDAHAVRAQIAVKTSSPGVRASCLIRAYAADHSVVGELSLPVTGVHGITVRRATLRTERAASAVDLVGCTAPGQKQPR